VLHPQIISEGTRHLIYDSILYLKFSNTQIIGYGIIEKSRVTGKSIFPKNAKMGILWRQGDTYAIVGQPSNLVVSSIFI
jgi:hypothetical protein